MLVGVTALVFDVLLRNLFGRPVVLVLLEDRVSLTCLCRRIISTSSSRDARTTYHSEEFTLRIHRDLRPGTFPVNARLQQEVTEVTLYESVSALPSMNSSRTKIPL
jgi:hypothetical protein